MCRNTTAPIPSVSIARCAHGVCHVRLGVMTLHLADDEVVLLAQAIHALAHRTPTLQAELYRAVARLPAMGYGHGPSASSAADAEQDL